MGDSDYNALMSKIDEMTRTINSLAVDSAVIKTKVTAMCKDEETLVNQLEQLRTIVFGDGKTAPGLDSRLRDVEKWISNRVWFERVIIGILAAEGIGMAFLVIKALTVL